MTSALLARTRRSSSVGGLDGWTTSTGRAGAPRILARRRFEAAGNVDTGSLKVDTWRSTDAAERTLWDRIDDPATEIVEQVATSTGYHQHRVVIPRGFTEIWATIDFRITARSGDDRTRIVGLAGGKYQGVLIGFYGRATQYDIWDHDLADTSAVAGGSFAVGDVWRHAVVYIKAATAAGNDGVMRAWFDGNTDAQAPDIETTHDHPLVDQILQFGSGSIGDATTFEIAECAVYDRDPLALTPYSSGWASIPLFQEIVPALSAIGLSPNPMAAQDGATSGTVIGTLSTTGGRGDGTWSLTGDLASIATINDTSVELTTTVSTGDDGTTGTISYSGDSAGGSAADITTSLGVTSATTSLTLTAASGGVQQQGTLDTSQPFQSLRMVPKSTPISSTWPRGDAPAEFDTLSGYRGFKLDPANTVILHVDSLSGGTGTGTLRWAASTNSGNSGEDLTGKQAVVVFDVCGHIELDGTLEFRNGPKWFAGQTAPVDGNGRSGIVVHGVNRNNDEGIYRRTFRDSQFVVEHLTFVDGRIPRNNDGSISPNREPPYGALDPGLDSNKSISRILLRNCSFFWGVDETVQVMGDPPFTSENRTDNVAFHDCWNGSPMYNAAANKRGYAMFVTAGAHRVEVNRTAMAGSAVRCYWQQGVTSTAAVNIFWYDCDRTIFLNTTSYTRVNLASMGPYGRAIDAIGCYFETGPSWLDRTPGKDFVMQEWGGTQADSVVTFFKSTDNWIQNTYDTVDHAGLPGFTDNGEPLYEHSRPPIPSEDLPSYILNHAGATPTARHSVMQSSVDTWQAGGSLVQEMRADGELRWPEEWPGPLIQATTSAANVPASPFAVESNGLTALENWLESEHVAKGGAPYQDFGRWLRFPWGGRVKVEADGTATFDPVDMPAGESGTIEVTRADGSVVAVRGKAS